MVQPGVCLARRFVVADGTFGQYECEADKELNTSNGSRTAAASMNAKGLDVRTLTDVVPLLRSVVVSNHASAGLFRENSAPRPMVHSAMETTAASGA